MSPEDAIEAIPPHILAGVWNDAMQYAYEEFFVTRPQLESLIAANPHRRNPS